MGAGLNHVSVVAHDLDEEAVRRLLAFVRAWLAGWQEPPRA